MNESYLIVFGALLAIVGGYIGDEIRSWRERSRERDSIKISLRDEISDIKSTIDKMHEVWTQASVLSSGYISSLISNTEAYDNLRIRLFLIKEEDVRKEIVGFYKELRDTCKKSRGKIGSLGDSTEIRTEQTNIHSDFQSLGTKAHTLIGKLKGE